MDNKTEVKHEFCNKCKCWRLPSDFLNTKGRKLKTCTKCRDRQKIRREKNKCEHKKQRSQCKDCEGGSICKHKRIRSRCKDCGGSSICEHKRQRSRCKDCGGSSICEHKRQRSQCKDCGGSSICEHKRQRSRCKDCGGSQICEHKRLRSSCKDCGGSSICEHKRRRSNCKDCDFQGYLGQVVRSRIYSALKQDKKLSSKEYLGCNMNDFKIHIEKQFKPGMTWDNYGEWHIDHIIPLKYKKPTLEQTYERLHFLNTQPLWASDNISKGNRYIG
jgi:hypothetical protein